MTRAEAEAEARRREDKAVRRLIGSVFARGVCDKKAIDDALDAIRIVFPTTSADRREQGS